MPGLSETGFDIPTLAEIVTEIETDLKTNIAADLNLQADSLLGNIVAIFAAKLHAIWEEMQLVYQSAYPNTATGLSLANVAAITGTIKKAATKSTVTATVNLNNGVTLPIGSGASVSGSPTMQYVTTAAVTNSTGVAANFSVAMEAVTAGSATFANSGTLTVIDTPVAGWNSVTNAADSNDGTDEETDAELRDRRETEIARPGTSPLDAIRADILDITTANGYVSNVTSCTVFENVLTDPVDANGLPIWKIEALVLGGLDADVASVLFAGKPAGTGTFGTSSAVVTDTAGNSHTVYFSRPTETALTIVLTVTQETTSTLTTAQLQQAVKDAIEAYGDTLALGQTVHRSDIIAAAMSASGVDSVDLSAPLTINAVAADYATGARELATIDTANITVNV